MSGDIWGYPEAAGHVPGTELIGYRVEASDGHIGKVDKHTEDVGRSYLVVDTGPWIFGRTVLLPAGLVMEIDIENETVHVARSKDEIKHAPEFERGQADDDITSAQLIADYYARRRM